MNLGKPGRANGYGFVGSSFCNHQSWGRWSWLLELLHGTFRKHQGMFCLRFLERTGTTKRGLRVRQSVGHCRLRSSDMRPLLFFPDALKRGLVRLNIHKLTGFGVAFNVPFYCWVEDLGAGADGAASASTFRWVCSHYMSLSKLLKFSIVSRLCYNLNTQK